MVAQTQTQQLGVHHEPSFPKTKRMARQAARRKEFSFLHFNFGVRRSKNVHTSASLKQSLLGHTHKFGPRLGTQKLVKFILRTESLLRTSHTHTHTHTHTLHHDSLHYYIFGKRPACIGECGFSFLPAANHTSSAIYLHKKRPRQGRPRLNFWI
jgi:hypothetical protein